MDWKISVNDFWEIVENGRRKDESEHEAARRITSTLMGMDTESVLQWGLIYERYHELAYQGKLWGAANIMDDGFCSDDGFHYFRGWLISQGRDTYHAALQDPDSLSALPTQEDVRFESVNYAAMKAYERLAGDDYYHVLEKMRLPPEIEKEMQSGIIFAPDIGDESYINGRYPHIFPNLTKLYDRSNQPVDIGAGDTEQVLSYMKKLNKFRYEDIDEGKTGIASLALAHEIVETIRDHTDIRLGGMYARVPFMLDLAGKIEARDTDSAAVIVQQTLAGHDDTARLVGRICSYDDELQAQFQIERDGGNHPDNIAAVADDLPKYPAILQNDPVFLDMAQKRAVHDKNHYTLASVTRRYSQKYSVDKMKDQRRIDPIGYTFAMRLAYTKACCLNSKNMVHVYNRHMEARAEQLGHQKIELVSKITPEEKKSIAEALAQAKQVAAQEQSGKKKDPKKSGPEL